ncbi:hypothetical protein M2160_005222 [Streptomyces sp. SAI-117]|nr:hypothetical protein [Streptomyces sp. SAI-117]
MPGRPAHGGVPPSVLVELSQLWDRAQAELSKSGGRLTLTRVSRDSGVPVATLSDWRRGNHAPREADELLKVVRLLCAWAKVDPPVDAHWRRLLDGSGPRSVPSVPPLPFGSTLLALGDRLTAAFAAPHVEIDALCLNGQSLALAMGHPIHAVHAGVVRPARIDVRVLLPSRDIELAFPCAVDVGTDGDGDESVHGSWLSLRNAHAYSMTAALRSLTATHGIDVTVQYRAMPFTPMAKLYLLNGTEALFSYYTITRHEVEVGHRAVEVYDPAAMGLVQAFGAGDNGADTAFVEQSHLWFNAIWETVSTEMSFM